MSLLRYFIIDSLTFAGSITPNSDDQQRITKIYLLLILQFALYYIGSILLFYFIIESWILSAFAAVLFTFIYFSISMVLLSGFRLSNYLQKGLKKNTNKTVLISCSAIDVSEVTYDFTKDKNKLISAVLLRVFFIIVFGFFIFIGLVLGISLYTKPNLDEEHRIEILNNYKIKNGKVTQIKVDLLSNKLELMNAKRRVLEINYKEAIENVKLAKDETHRMIFATDTAHYHKALIDWDFIHQNDLNTIPQSIHDLQADYDTGYKKLDFTTAHKKFGIYRIKEFRNNNAFWFWLFFLISASLFILPYYFRFKMVLTNTPLDLALEEKIISKIKKDYRSFHHELNSFHKKYGVEFIEEPILYEEAPFHKKNKDDGEIVALKNQMNTFLNNEL
jgi:hypothetical protein